MQAEGPSLAVKGPKGTLRIPLPHGIQLEKQDGHLLLKRETDEQAALHGLARSLLANAVHGVPRVLRGTWISSALAIAPSPRASP